MKPAACIALAALALVALVPGLHAQRAAPRVERPVTSPPDFLAQYCVTCHNGRLTSGGLALDSLDRANVVGHAEAWEKVVRKVRTGLMPPDGAPKPPQAARETFVAGLENDLDLVAARDLDPGAPALHRLNRAEYANVVRDLLALDVDVTALLPPDDSAAGFDNIADVLGVSPSLLERYVAAAAKISRLAVGERDAAPAQVTYTLKGDLSQNQTLDGQPLGTRGGTTLTHNFPVDGEYVIRLALLKLSFGQVFGEGAEGEELEVTLNGQRVKLFKLDEVPMFFMRESPGSHPAKPQPTDPLEERVKMTPDIRLEFRLKVKAGPQAIGVSFLQKARTVNEDLVRRPVSSTYDVFIGMQYGYATAPHLSRVVITGPYDPTGLGDTPSRRRVFVCRPVVRAEEDGCARQIVAALVRRAYRRAPTDADVEPLLAFHRE